MTKRDFFEIMKRTQAPLENMVKMIPDDKLNWAPDSHFMNMGQLIRHLSENWVIIKMMITNEWPFSDPKEMENAMKLENMPSCSKEEAIKAMKEDLDNAIAYLKNDVSEEDFFNTKVSAPWGFEGEIWKAALMAKDHQMNHKMQLHQYLKILNQPVNTNTLYGM